MKIFKICLLLFMSSSILLAVSPEEFQNIASQYKMIDNSKEDIPPISFRTRDGKVTMYFNKTHDEDGYFISPIVKFDDKIIYQQDGYESGISNYDIHSFGVICYNKDNQLLSTLSISYSNIYIKQKSINYENHVTKIDYENPKWDNYLNGINSSSIFNNDIFGTYIPYNQKHFNPYYNEEKILERLYETGTCDKEATKNANIEVLVGDKWIPQEKSWNIQDTIKILTIQTLKQPLYSEPQIKTKMYLIKGDKVEILEEKDDWLYILYKGKKDIKAWIPKSAVE
jgi:hypothetical protein